MKNPLPILFNGLILSIFLMTFQPFHSFGKTAGFILTGGAKSVRIPVEIQNNVILIPVRINGSFEMNFILDTGVRTTILTEPYLLSWLQIDSLSTITVRGLGEGAEIEASLAQNIRMSLPGVEGFGMNMVVLPENLISYSSMFGKPVYGIIGYEVFGQFTVQINYAQKYIKLYNPFSYKPPKGRRWESIPIEVRKGKPYMEAILTDFRNKKFKRQWLLDTGASMAVSLFHDELPTPDPSVPAFLGMGLSGNVYGHLGRNPLLEIGPFQLEDILTGYPEESSLGLLPESIEWYGNIGSDVISRFHIVFDYTRQHIYLKKNSRFNRSFHYNVSGLEFISIGKDYEQFLVSYVRPNSPADDAGIQVNDILLNLNGQSVNEMNIEQLYGGLIRKPGKIVRLKIQRNEEVLKKRFRLEKGI